MLQKNSFDNNEFITFKVKTKKLDNLLFDKNIGFIKIDVEGFEHEVLLGCLQSFKEKKIKKIMCEVHHSYLESKGKSEELIFDFLREYNFTITPISRDLEVVKEWYCENCHKMLTSDRVHILATL